MQDENAPKYYSLYINVSYAVQMGKGKEDLTLSQIHTCIYRDRLYPERALAARNECRSHYNVGQSFTCLYKRDEPLLVRTLDDVQRDSSNYRTTILVSGSFFLVCNYLIF